MDKHDRERHIDHIKNTILNKFSIEHDKVMIGGKIVQVKNIKPHCVHYTWDEEKQCLALVSGEAPEDDFIPFTYKTRTVIGNHDVTK